MLRSSPTLCGDVAWRRRTTCLRLNSSRIATGTGILSGQQRRVPCTAEFARRKFYQYVELRRQRNHLTWIHTLSLPRPVLHHGIGFMDPHIALQPHLQYLNHRDMRLLDGARSMLGESALSRASQTHWHFYRSAKR